MSSQNSYSSSSSSSTRSASPAPDAPLASPARISSPTLELRETDSAQSAIISSPPLDTSPFNPHALGLGISSPQPILGPFAASMSRTNYSPHLVRSPPSHHHNNPFDSPSYNRSSFDESMHRPQNMLDDHPPPASPSLAYLSVAPSHPAPPSPLVQSGLDESPHNPGLRIAIPPNTDLASSLATPSPPLVPGFPHAPDYPITSAFPPDVSLHLNPNGVADVPYSQNPGADIGALPNSELTIELTEFDSEGLSTLEKIYLFSRSRAGFQRVFIAHALPGYLAAGSGSDPILVDSDESDSISPDEGVEYVLPLLNILATDEDEAVKEALAAELVPIIWWFITHCKLVEHDTSVPFLPAEPLAPTSSPEVGHEHEYDPELYTEGVYASPDFQYTPHASTGEQTLISVQAFTPILGTLLLSPNGHIGGAARYAVVELLRRVRRVDERDDPHLDLTPGTQQMNQSHPGAEDDGDLETGLLGREERVLFEREMVQQVVIGMGRLDIPEDMSLEDEVASSHSSVTTAVPTPSAPHTADAEGDSYFPILTSPFVPHSSAPPVQLQQIDTSLEDWEIQARPPSSASSDSSPSLTSCSSRSSDPSPDILFSGEAVTPDPEQPVDQFTKEPEDGWLPPASPRPRHAQLPSRPTDFQSFTAPAATGRISPLLEAGNDGPSWLQAALTGEHEETGIGEIAARGADETDDEDEGDVSEEAAVGRLSSMSMMAAVAASGSIADETKIAFVSELDRVGRDPVYWVRREASFAVGALAKIVPQEVVICSLLPLFESLYRDSSWHVRHSALFALPAILSKLSPEKRRQLALDVMVPLSHDESSTVRSGVLEAIGEVMYTFHVDDDGPPDELVRLFLGIREGETQARPVLRSASTHRTPWSEFMARALSGSAEEMDIYDDPARPLVCAFNYPAVTLTLGRERWHELHPLYADLSKNPSLKVRRTLAASLGEMSKILGTEVAERDLIEVWWSSIRAEEGEVRLKVIECLDIFLGVIGVGLRADVIRGLDEAVERKQFKGWREREELMKILPALAKWEGVEKGSLKTLLRRGLEDNIAAVREMAVASLPLLWRAWRNHPQWLTALHDSIGELAQSSSYRKRMSFVTCEQALILSESEDYVLSDDQFWRSLHILAQDQIVDVRIRVARLIGILKDKYTHLPTNAVRHRVLELVDIVSRDSSNEVQAFMKHGSGNDISPMAATFSRPPPPSPS